MSKRKPKTKTTDESELSKLKVDPFIYPVFTQVKDGIKITGLKEGVMVVDECMVPKLMQMSMVGELFPYFIITAVIDEDNPDQWFMGVRRANSKVEGDKGNAKFQV